MREYISKEMLYTRKWEPILKKKQINQYTLFKYLELL